METDKMHADRSSFEAYLKFLAEATSDGTPQVLETQHALSLHFNALATQSFMSRKEPDKLVLGYTRTMMGFLLLHPAPARISMIGLGGGSLAKYCYRHLANTKVVAIEINPAVIALREQFQIPPDDERFEVVCADGAEYVANQMRVRTSSWWTASWPTACRYSLAPRISMPPVMHAWPITVCWSRIFLRAIPISRFTWRRSAPHSVSRCRSPLPKTVPTTRCSPGKDPTSCPL